MTTAHRPGAHQAASLHRIRAAAFMLLATGAMMIVATTPALGAHVEPVFVASNPSCESIESTWAELKVEPVADGTYSDGTLTVTIDQRDRVFDWSSNIGVDAVIVKGGPDANLYRYDPPAEETEDTGLHAPTNASNDEFYGLSHISFCYDTGGPSPSPSPSPSPTETETSSPSPSPTVSLTPTPSPTILGTQTERPRTSPTSTVAGERLAKSGSSRTVVFLMFVGAGAVLTGLLLLGASFALGSVPPTRKA